MFILKGVHMKKSFLLIICMAMLVSITSCVKSGNSVISSQGVSSNITENSPASENGASAASGASVDSNLKGIFQSQSSALSTTSNSRVGSSSTSNSAQSTTSISKSSSQQTSSATNSAQSTTSISKVSSQQTSSATSSTPVAHLWQRDALRAATLGQSFINGFYNKSNYLLLQYKNQASPATAWEYFALMGMQNKLAMLDSSQTSLFNNIIYGLDYYGAMKDGNFWAYQAYRYNSVMIAPATQYAYDDNGWISIELTHSYEITGNTAYLQRAETIMNNLLIGQAWFSPLGGFRWDYRNEPARPSCSTNDTVKEFLDLYKYTGDSYYLDWAKKVYDWMDSHLRNKSLNIYYNQVWAAQNNQGQWVESTVDDAYYTYNTGTAITAAASLYGVTKDKRYLSDAEMLANGAYNYFGNRNVRSGYVDYLTSSTGMGNVWFSSVLLTGFTDLYQYDPDTTMKYIQAFQNGIDYGYDHYYANGMIPRDWLKGWTQDDNLWALDHSANAQIYAQLALFYKQYANTY